MSRIGVAVLGSTGSIGTQALDVISRLGDQFEVIALAAGNNIDLLTRQVATFKPKVVVARGAHEIGGVRVLPTPEGLIEAATHPDVDIVLAATSGHDAIRATWAAIEAGKTIAIANKETIVCAGDLIIPLAATHNVELRPVDSEHSAIWQCLRSRDTANVNRLILTASGGPFLRTPHEQLASVTVADALAHPTWSMGNKLTIDSATMMNKGLEIIEAHHLFNMPFDRIDVVIHRDSVVHSLIEWDDFSTLAQLSPPDMRLPIQFALTYPHHIVSPCQPLDLTRAFTLSFEPPDMKQFPALRLAIQAGESGKTYPTVLSAADEVAVAAFMAGKISFLGIAEIVESTLAAHVPVDVSELAVVFEADKWAHEFANNLISRRPA
jgi:1-deoxy-D-xylulose-5-phosphate reductoisomerase